MNTQAIEIINPGLLSTVQDRGRFGYQHMGVPVSGAMDQWALRMGNILLGNDDHEAAIEITMGNFQCRFLREAFFAVTGPNRNASVNGCSVPSWGPVHARKGDLLSLGPAANGARDYLCLAGGIDVPIVLGSKSTYLRGKFGGFEGRELKKGDIVWAGAAASRVLKECPEHLIPSYSQHLFLRVILGPQDDALSEESLHALLHEDYEVTDRSDRMGCLLQGPILTHRKGPDIVSDGIALGSIQVPGNGQPIVLLADRPTTGGYTKPATVASFDIPLIAQALPGWKVRFSAIDLMEAREIYMKKEYRLRSLAWKVG